MPKSLHTPLYQRFRELLIAARQAAGLNQRQVAARLARPQSYVSKYETGERDLNIVEFLAVARALDLDPVAVLRRLLDRSQSLSMSNRRPRVLVRVVANDPSVLDYCRVMRGLTIRPPSEHT